MWPSVRKISLFVTSRKLLLNHFRKKKLKLIFFSNTPLIIRYRGRTNTKNVEASQSGLLERSQGQRAVARG